MISSLTFIDLFVYFASHRTNTTLRDEVSARFDINYNFGISWNGEDRKVSTYLNRSSFSYHKNIYKLLVFVFVKKRNGIYNKAMKVG